MMKTTVYAIKHNLFDFSEIGDFGFSIQSSKKEPIPKEGNGHINIFFLKSPICSEPLKKRRITVWVI